MPRRPSSQAVPRLPVEGGRTATWLPVLALCGGLLWASTASAHASTDAGGGPVLRLQLDASALYLLGQYSGEAAGPGSRTAFRLDGRRWVPGLGGGFEAGYRIALRRGFALSPHVFVGLAALESQEVSIWVAGVEHVVASDPVFWAAGAGVELLPPWRFASAAVGLGVAGVQDAPTAVSPAGLELTGGSQRGLHGRLRLLLHGPDFGSLHPGLVLALSGYLWPSAPIGQDPATIAGRVLLGLFVQWDGGQR